VNTGTTDPRRHLPAPLLAMAGGVLMALAFPLVVPWISLRQLDPDGHLEWIAWVALVPALFALDRARGAKGAFALGLVAGLSFFYSTIYWVSHAMTAFGGLSFGLALLALSLLVLYMAFHWGLAFAVSHIVRRRLGWPLWVHLPAVWAAAELLRNYLFSGFPWANLGYAQARHPAVSQLASLFGIYAIAALVVLMNCAAHEAIRAIRERRPFPGRLAAVATLLLLGVVVHGWVRLSSVRARMASAPMLRVGLVQGNVDQASKNEARSHAAFILGRYLPLTEQADRSGADLIVWPEAAYPLFVPPDIRSFAGAGSGLAPLGRAHLLLGASTLQWQRSLPLVTNALFLLRPDLTVSQRYAKHHLVPFGEYVPLGEWLPFVRQVVPNFAPTSPGSALVTMRFAVSAGSNGEASLAPMICYDAIFPEINLTYADSDPELLVNPTNDAWYGYSSGPYQFLAITRLRAIEAGKAMIRPAYAGVTAVILPTGEIAPGAIEVGPVDGPRSPDPDEPPRLLLAEVPRLHGRTLYTSIGDLFAWVCAGLAVVWLAMAWRRADRQDIGTIGAGETCPQSPQNASRT
jgi:apolipoprotein N-acyltransferase